MQQQSEVVAVSKSKQTNLSIGQMSRSTLLPKIFPVALCIAAIAMVTSCSAPRGGQYIRETEYSEPIRVACVGDSITYGYGIKDREYESYPAQLAELLGKKWE